MGPSLPPPFLDLAAKAAKSSNPLAKQCEIATMQFVRESGLFPVPKVHAWDTTFSNPAGAPYVLMAVVPGVNLADVRETERGRVEGLDYLGFTLFRKQDPRQISLSSHLSPNWMADKLATQISALKELYSTPKWVDLNGLINCATTHLASSGLRPDLDCVRISLLGRGSYNTVYKLQFSDGTQLAASVSKSPSEKFNPSAKQSEIATMKFVRESGLFPDVPVPKIHAWDTTFSNLAGAPYVLMDIVPGVNLADTRGPEPRGLRGLDYLGYEQQDKVVKALAVLQASLSRPLPSELTKIGSIALVDLQGKPQYNVGPFVTSRACLGGPFTSMQDVWRAKLEYEALYTVEQRASLDNSSPPEPACTPETFAELYQQLSSLIDHLRIPARYSRLVLHHPDLALRNVLFDPDTLKITGVIDWAGAQILPLVLTATYPDDLLSAYDRPFTHPDVPKNPYPDCWSCIPFDWTHPPPESYPAAFIGPDMPADFRPLVGALVRRVTLRARFAAYFDEEMRKRGYSDSSLATLFSDAQEYLRFNETLFRGWYGWMDHERWIKSSYERVQSSRKKGDI
ncbi:hypothetical protein EYR38_006259 [Pleurotus pulmonarius]|nr:hypothetical protein EYR38_006259 [Pleurotus pulmonarius]